MNWDAIGAVGEIVGAVAVVISLIYLAGQVRHNNRFAGNTSLQSVLQSEMYFASIVIENAEIWDKLIAGDSFESRGDNRKAIVLYNLYLLDASNRYFQFSAGYLDAKNWEGRKNALHDLVTWPVFDTWRTSLGAMGHSNEFLELIDSIHSSEIDKKDSDADGTTST